MDDPNNTTSIAGTTDTSTEIAAAGSFTDVSSNFSDYVLAEIRCAGLRAQIMVNDIEAMTVALGAGLVNADTALAHLHEVGVLHLIEASS
jgi:hypothetical protein